jgi:CTP:molybdopterin cytidylyltransferase MocA
MTFDAVVTAGGTLPKESSLYNPDQGGLKALLPVAGKPMLQWVLDVLSASSVVRNIVVVGLPPEVALSSQKPLVYIADQGEMLANIIAGARWVLEHDPSQQNALLVSSDIPGIRVEMLEWLAQNANESSMDLYYTVIERQAMERRFPTSNRTYLRLKDREVCGGDIHVFRLQAVLEKDPLWKQIIDQRKNPLRQAALVGFDTLFGIFTRTLTLDQTVANVCRRLHLNARALVSPYAEMGMDVDKPHQFEIMQRELSARVSE